MVNTGKTVDSDQIKVGEYKIVIEKMDSNLIQEM
jgi:hypothetical protein